MQLQWDDVQFDGSTGSTVPIGRAGHCTTILGDRLYLLGGANRCGLHFNDVWFLTLQNGVFVGWGTMGRECQLGIPIHAAASGRVNNVCLHAR